MIDNYRKAQRRPAEASERELAGPGEGAERVNELLNRVLMEEALLRLSARTPGRPGGTSLPPLHRPGGNGPA